MKSVKNNFFFRERPRKKTHRKAYCDVVLNGMDAHLRSEFSFFGYRLLDSWPPAGLMSGVCGFVNGRIHGEEAANGGTVSKRRLVNLFFLLLLWGHSPLVGWKISLLVSWPPEISILVYYYIFWSTSPDSGPPCSFQVNQFQFDSHEADRLWELIQTLIVVASLLITYDCCPIGRNRRKNIYGRWTRPGVGDLFIVWLSAHFSTALTKFYSLEEVRWLCHVGILSNMENPMNHLTPLTRMPPLEFVCLMLTMLWFWPDLPWNDAKLIRWTLHSTVISWKWAGPTHSPWDSSIRPGPVRPAMDKSQPITDRLPPRGMLSERSWAPKMGLRGLFSAEETKVVWGPWGRRTAR